MKKKPTKKELLKMPLRGWAETSHEYDQILLVPAGTKHESGFMHIAIIGVIDGGEKTRYEICGYPDDISCFFPYEQVTNRPWALVRMDCWYPQGVLQYHGRGKFKVSEALSSQEITFMPLKELTSPQGE